MILFHKDWYDNQHAIVHNNTKNTSFLRYSALLKNMGIKNYLFPLQLHDPLLDKVDPYDEDLDQETMVRIAIECKVNPWYFFREVARASGGTRDNPIRFIANRASMALYWLYFNNITVIWEQIRQTGKTYSVNMLYIYLLNVALTNSEINFMTKEETQRSGNMRRIKLLDEILPWYLRQRQKRDPANSELIHISNLDTRLVAHVAQSSTAGADKVMRGSTANSIWFDEAAFIKNISVTYPAALPALSAASVIADRKSEPHGLIITTTSGNLDDDDGMFVWNMIDNSAIWNELFLDSKDKEELNNLVRKNSKGGIPRVSMVFHHRQLGYTDRWLKEQLEELNASPEDIARDYGNVWKSGTRSSPFTPKQAEAIRNSQVNDYYTEINKGYITRWYIPKEEIQSRMHNGNYVMGIDSSDAIGKDDIAMVIRDVHTGEIIACGTYNETNIIYFSEWLVSWIMRYDKLTVIIERRSTGSSILDYLLLMLPEKNIDPFARLFNRVVQEADEYPQRIAQINKPMYLRDRSINVTFKKYFGFATSATGYASRDELYSTTLQNTIKLTADSIKDKYIINQLLGLVIKNGRIDHQTGGHDDLVIALLMSSFLLLSGKNLDYYGINPREILSRNTAHQVDNNPKAKYDRYEQEVLKEEIANLIEVYKETKDKYLSMRIESELLAKVSQMNEHDRNVIAIDDLIAKLKENKAAMLRKRYY
jgi:hypothetical protein